MNLGLAIKPYGNIKRLAEAHCWMSILLGSWFLGLYPQLLLSTGTIGRDMVVAWGKHSCPLTELPGEETWLYTADEISLTNSWENPPYQLLGAIHSLSRNSSTCYSEEYPTLKSSTAYQRGSLHPMKNAQARRVMSALITWQICKTFWSTHLWHEHRSKWLKLKWDSSANTGLLFPNPHHYPCIPKLKPGKDWFRTPPSQPTISP